MRAMARKRASNEARPRRSFENDAPPCLTTLEALVKTFMDMQLPTSPKSDTAVRRMPSVTKRKVSSDLA